MGNGWRRLGFGLLGIGGLVALDVIAMSGHSPTFQNPAFALGFTAFLTGAAGYIHLMPVD